jgi:hypothetical protein
MLVCFLLAVIALSVFSTTGHASAGITWCRNCASFAVYASPAE